MPWYSKSVSMLLILEWDRDSASPSKIDVAYASLNPPKIPYDALDSSSRLCLLGSPVISSWSMIKYESDVTNCHF